MASDSLVGQHPSFCRLCHSCERENTGSVSDFSAQKWAPGVISYSEELNRYGSEANIYKASILNFAHIKELKGNIQWLLSASSVVPVVSIEN